MKSTAIDILTKRIAKEVKVHPNMNHITMATLEKIQKWIKEAKEQEYRFGDSWIKEAKEQE